MEEVKTKVCSKCGEEKPLTEEFWYLRHYAYGKSYYEGPCRICHKTRAKELRNNIRKEKKEKRKTYQSLQIKLVLTVGKQNL